MGSKYTHVFTPLQVKGITFRNRIINSPGVPSLASNDGCSTPQLRDFHAAYARGGAAVVTIGNASLNMTDYRDESRQIDLANPRTFISLNELVEGIEHYGAVANIEINHPGMHVPLEDACSTVTAMPIGPSGIPGKVQEMDQAMIDKIVNDYATAAYNCMKAGFRMVMIHGAHGNLIPQFVSPFTNHRTDKYGGSLENRARFAIEVLDAIRAKCGNDLVIEYRIAAEEYAENGMHIEDTIEFVKMIEDKIDMLHVSSGMVHVVEYVRYMISPSYMEHMINVKFSRALKQAGIKVTMGVVGSIMNLDNAEKILADGDADYVCMYRPFQADPNLVKKCSRNHPEDVTPCIRCQYESRIRNGQVAGCAVNPILGRENEFPNGKVPLSPEPKKVAIIGGGAAGMQAARTAVDRGHDVTLFEKSGALGGSLIPATALDFKEDLRSYLKWAIRATENCGCKIRLNTEVTPELIEHEGFEAIVVAVGADPIIPKVPGIDRPNVHWGAHADMGLVEVGQKVVIVGGGMVGYECAVGLGREGKDVTVVDMLPVEQLPTGAGPRHESGFAIALLEMANEAHVKEMGGVKLVEVNDEGAVVEDANGKRTTLPADTVLLAVGMRPRKEEAEKFRHVIAECDIQFAGDCNKARIVGNAVYEGFNAALAL
ncbi:MAG: FAD-dependent oxidoreductase [Oscillospiraceae bacterium]|nr:FAD-dependent oxidoreductase [Oscillospiraceae bacterium]